MQEKGRNNFLGIHRGVWPRFLLEISTGAEELRGVRVGRWIIIAGGVPGGWVSPHWAGRMSGWCLSSVVLAGEWEVGSWG